MSYPATPELLGSLGLKSGEMTFYRGKGCPACKDTGYQGRVGIFELLEINEAVRGLIVAKAPSSSLKAAAAQAGFRTLRQDGLIKAAAGVTTVEEVLRVTQEAEGV
jgi:type II secretory ATPase GspE/PulE/Tfp pilus assembly ATPase PilB-like protein